MVKKISKKKVGKVRKTAKQLKEKLYCNCRIQPLALGLTFGLIGIFYIVCISLMANTVGMGTEWVKLTADIYYGYATTLSGTIIGMAWCFTDCFVLGIVIGYVYNWLVRKLRK